jgi:hypothetical protein
MVIVAVYYECELREHVSKGEKMLTGSGAVASNIRASRSVGRESC